MPCRSSGRGLERSMFLFRLLQRRSRVRTTRKSSCIRSLRCSTHQSRRSKFTSGLVTSRRPTRSSFSRRPSTRSPYDDARSTRTSTSRAPRSGFSGSGASWRFPHDRIHEAAYRLLPDHEQAATHLRIGQQLLAVTPPDEREGRSFELARQLNRGASLLNSAAERELVAHLDRIAGRRAQSAGAHAAALGYFERSWAPRGRHPEAVYRKLSDAGRVVSP